VMTFVEFTKLCQVWHLEKFWHVHINMNNAVSYDMPSFHILDLSEKNPDCLIRFSSPNGAIRWLKNRQDYCPFEPAFYSSHSPLISIKFDHFDMDRVFTYSYLDIQHGEYHITWNQKELELDEQTNLMGLSLGTEEFVHSGPDSSHRPAWIKLQSTFSVGEVVRKYGTRTVEWKLPLTSAAGLNHMQRKTFGSPTVIQDMELYERGKVLEDGTLEIVRLIPSRIYRWAINLNGAEYHHHRGDGPAIVTLYDLKEVIHGNKRSTIHMGTYQNDWIINDKEISGHEVSEFCRRNNTAIRQGPLHEKSAFLNEQDEMIWVAAHS